MKLKILLSSILYIVIFVIISNILLMLIYDRVAGDFFKYEMLYKEPKNSIDIVVIGSSPADFYWNYLYIWKKFNITSIPLTYPCLGLFQIKYTVKETLKTQKPKLLIISLDTQPIHRFENNNIRMNSHREIMFLKPSLNKLQFINETNKYTNKYARRKLTLFEKAEFYFPIIRFHHKWKTIDFKNDRAITINGTKHIKRIGFFSNEYFYLQKTNKIFPSEQPLNEDDLFLLEDLFGYLKTLDIPVLLINAPIDKSYGHKLLEKNIQIKNLSKKYNLEYLDINSDEFSSSINLTTEDFLDEYHLNYKGDIKFLNYFVPYLMEKYNITGEHSKDVQTSWNISFFEYAKWINNDFGVNYFDL